MDASLVAAGSYVDANKASPVSALLIDVRTPVEVLMVPKTDVPLPSLEIPYRTPAEVVITESGV